MIVYALIALVSMAIGFIIGQIINLSKASKEYKKSNNLLIDAMQELNNLIIKLRRDLGMSQNINKFLQDELEEFNKTVRKVRVKNGEIICKQEVKDSQESVWGSE